MNEKLKKKLTELHARQQYDRRMDKINAILNNQAILGKTSIETAKYVRGFIRSKLSEKYFFKMEFSNQSEFLQAAIRILLEWKRNEILIGALADSVHVPLVVCNKNDIIDKIVDLFIAFGRNVILVIDNKKDVMIMEYDHYHLGDIFTLSVPPNYEPRRLD